MKQYRITWRDTVGNPTETAAYTADNLSEFLNFIRLGLITMPPEADGLSIEMVRDFSEETHHG